MTFEPIVSAPEGGASLLYLFLAAAACSIVIFISSRKRLTAVRHRLHLGAEPREAAPHVGDPSRNPDPSPCRKRDHRRRLVSTTRTTAASTLPSRLIRTSPGSSI